MFNIIRPILKPDSIFGSLGMIGYTIVLMVSIVGLNFGVIDQIEIENQDILDKEYYHIRAVVEADESSKYAGYEDGELIMPNIYNKPAIKYLFSQLQKNKSIYYVASYQLGIDLSSLDIANNIHPLFLSSKDPNIFKEMSGCCDDISLSANTNYLFGNLVEEGDTGWQGKLNFNVKHYPSFDRHLGIISGYGGPIDLFANTILYINPQTLVDELVTIDFTSQALDSFVYTGEKEGLEKIVQRMNVLESDSEDRSFYYVVSSSSFDREMEQERHELSKYYFILVVIALSMLLLIFLLKTESLISDLTDRLRLFEAYGMNDRLYYPIYNIVFFVKVLTPLAIAVLLATTLLYTFGDYYFWAGNEVLFISSLLTFFLITFNMRVFAYRSSLNFHNKNSKLKGDVDVSNS